MASQLRNPNFYIVLSADIVLIVVSLFSAYLIRFEFKLSVNYFHEILSLIPLMISVKIIFLLYFNVYRGLFRFVGLSDLWALFKALVSASILIVTIIVFLRHFQGFSRAVFIIDGGLTFLLLGGLRLGIRIAYQRREGRRPSGNASSSPVRREDDEATIIIGAGGTGEKILREIQSNPRLRFRVVGFIDDNIHKLKRTIHNIPVLGTMDDLPQLAKQYKIKQALIAAPTATGKEIRRMVEACNRSNILYKTLPGIAELIDGKVSIKELRDVNYRDLLRREPVRLNVSEIQNYIQNKRIMITGAGGSIGSELCRQIARFQPDMMLLFDASEPNLYGIEMELRHRVGYLKYIVVLGQTQDERLMDRMMKQYRPHVVFHAAAYKHVPMLERNPWQAVLNNVMGTKVVMETALRHKVEHFVMVSTDKAVRPTNVMGASKRICELMAGAFMDNGTRMMTVRFGNVVNSAGSVLPLFREQIARGGPVTITHPEVTRFFMTIPEAAQLILQAAAFGEGGETFILEMGTPMKILEMARDLIRLSGKEPDEDIEIVFTGLREGEKLYEELITEDEGVVETSHEKIMVLKAQDSRAGKENRAQYRQWLNESITALEEAAKQYDGRAIRLKMKDIVPEYDLQDSDAQ